MVLCCGVVKSVIGEGVPLVRVVMGRRTRWDGEYCQPQRPPLQEP